MSLHKIDNRVHCHRIKERPEIFNISFWEIAVRKLKNKRKKDTKFMVLDKRR